MITYTGNSRHPPQPVEPTENEGVVPRAPRCAHQRGETRMSKTERQHVEYRVISEVDGHVSERDDRQSAERRARELEDEYGHEHHVERHVEVF